MFPCSSDILGNGYIEMISVTILDLQESLAGMCCFTSYGNSLISPCLIFVHRRCVLSLRMSGRLREPSGLA